MLRRRALLAGPALALPAITRAQEVVLRLHHFLPALSNMHRHFLVPWARQIAAASDNALRIRIFPSMQLGGAPPQLYDQARDGVADIVWTLPGNTPGRFPRVEVWELPFVAHQRAAVNVRAVQDYADRHLAHEFREVHPLCVWAHDHGLIHARRKVAALEDLRGLKLRFPTRLSGEALRALGAAPVGMPIPQVPEAMAAGVIEGAVVPWEVVPAIRLSEMARFHTEIPGSPTFYVATFILAMNRARHEALPAELRAVLDAHAGPAAADMIARVWDEQGPAVEAQVKRRGNAVTVLAPAEKARWVAATAPVTAAWETEMAAKGLDGAALLAEARALVQRHGARAG